MNSMQMNLYSEGSDGTKIQNSWSRVGTLTNALDHLITLDPPRRGPFSLSLFPWLVLNIAWTELLNSADLKPDWNRTCYRFFFLLKIVTTCADDDKQSRVFEGNDSF